MIQDQVVHAQYTNPDHTELEYVSTVNGRQRISQANNAHAWLHVHQRVILKSFDETGTGTARPLINVTPARDSANVAAGVQMSTPVAPPRMPPQVIEHVRDEPRPVVPAAPAQQPIYDQAMGPMPLAMSHDELEIAAEWAVVAMVPDGAVDPARKELAVSYLTRESELRGVDLESLCRALRTARDERNTRVMAERLKRMSSLHG